VPSHKVTWYTILFHKMGIESGACVITDQMSVVGKMQEVISSGCHPGQMSVAACCPKNGFTSGISRPSTLLMRFNETLNDGNVNCVVAAVFNAWTQTQSLLNK